MITAEFHMPSPEEIDAQIRAAHKARADAAASWFRSLGHWLAHPHFGHRAA